MTHLYDFALPALRGGDIPLASFRGRPVLVVNTACGCGFTPQLGGLELLYQSYREDGLVVLGVPSNDFAGQEPGGPEEIAEFCTVNYGVDFPMAAKQHVRGDHAHPLFAWLAQEGGFLARPRWNFYKYLIGRDGRLEHWFSSLTRPSAGRLGRAITAALARAA